MSAPFNPAAWVVKAAQGDLDAQRAMARHCADLAVRDRNELAAFEGLLFARLACARSGSEPGDVKAMLHLISVVRTFATTPELIGGLDAEAIARASLLADAGDEEAIDTLATVLAEASDEANETATRLRSCIVEGTALANG